MKYTKIILLTLTLSLPLFGCGKKEEPVAPPVTEETVEEIEPTEPVEEATDQQDGLNEGTVIDRGDTTTVDSGSGSDIKVDGDLVEGTTLTQEEIDELKASAPTDFAKENVEIYEAITKNGGWDDGYGNVYTKVVGKPDGSWRRMTDEEAKAILAKGESAEGYYTAKAELQDKEFYVEDYANKTIWFDYYAWLERDNVFIPELPDGIDNGEVKFAEPGKWDHLFN